MVLDDVFNPRRSDPATGSSHDPDARGPGRLDEQLASPIDRLAAVVADLILIVPVIALLIAPFTLRAKQAQIIGEDAWLETTVLSGALLAAAAWIIYQTVFIALYGGSPGKMILRLRVVSVWSGAKPNFHESFWRSLVWVGEGALLGVPFLSVFSNLRRRPLHDRAADTRVIVLAREREIGLSTLPEMSLASGFQSACLAMAALVFSLNYFQYQTEQSATMAESLKREDEGRLCPEVREAIQESHARKVGSVRDRLEMALLLSSAEQLESLCLEQEADFALWKNGPKALAYLAKGLVVGARSDKKSQEYLSEACREAHSSGQDADACRLATLVKSEIRAETDDEEATDDIEVKQKAVQREAEAESIISGLSKDWQPYLVVAAAKRLVNAGEVERALDLLDSLHEVRRLGGFVARERAKALWRMGRKSESLAAMRSVIDMSEPRARLETARWFCDRETGLGACGEGGQVACSELRRSIDREPHAMMRSEVAAIYIRGERCLSDKPDWREMKGQVPSEEGKSLLEALALIDEGDDQAAREALRALAKGSGEEGSSAFQIEAKTKLIDLAKSKDELAKERLAWEKSPQDSAGWQALGRHLVAKLCALRSWDDAIAVGLKIVKADPSDRETYAMMIDAAQGAGHTQLAAGLMAQAPGRSPASQSPKVKSREPGRKAGP